MIALLGLLLVPDTILRSLALGAIIVGLITRAIISSLRTLRTSALEVAQKGKPIASMFYNSLSMIAATTDEFMRMLAVRQQLIAAGFALAVATVWGTLDRRSMPAFCAPAIVRSSTSVKFITCRTVYPSR